MKQILNIREKGITLVALVITIIIILILAGVTLTTSLSQNGLFQRAKLAGDEYKKSESEEGEKLKEGENEIDKVIDEMNVELPTISEAIEKGEEFTKDGNKKIVDEFNNQMTIPQGFHIVKHGEDSVEYNYSEKNKNIPTVQDGIVIKDDIGNQFVWIPVGKINNKEESEEKTTKIILGRYTFGSDGTPSDAYNGSEVIESYFIEENDEEHKKSGYSNIISQGIEEFKTSVEKNHGYYIARYEAGKGSDGKPVSKQGAVWHNVNQASSSTAAKKMYENNDNYTSDLINSYVWDTTIVFIQKYSVNKNYSNQKGRNYSSSKSVPDASGERGGTTDKVCNIYDMASNCYEWTTETSKDNSAPCVDRGGTFYTQDIAKRRGKGRTIDGQEGACFRVILYIL